MTDEAVVHIAGEVVTIGPQIRQRCSWCGAVLIDEDLSRIAVPIDQAGQPYPTWEVGRLIAVAGGGGFRAIGVIEHEDGAPLPDNACGRLPHDVTGARS